MKLCATPPAQPRLQTLSQRSNQPGPTPPAGPDPDRVVLGTGLAAGAAVGAGAYLAAAPLLSSGPLPALVGLSLAGGLGAYLAHSAINTPRWGENALQGSVSRRLRQGLVKASQAEDKGQAAGLGARVGAESGAVVGALSAGAAALASSLVTQANPVAALASVAGAVLLGAVGGACAGGAAGALGGALSDKLLTPVSQPQTVGQLDLERYLGDWYEIARYPNVFQREPEAARQSFQVVDGKIVVTNTGYDPKSGEFRSVTGRTWQEDPSKVGQFKVSFAPVAKDKEVLGEDYWVLSLDPNYQWVAVGDPSRSFLWIMSRQPQMDAETEAGIRQQLSADGWDLKPLLASPTFPAEPK